jgi:UDP-N-acetylmuramyl tripeptide synthase
MLALPPTLLDSRRIPGISLLWDRPCAALDFTADAGDLAPLLSAWQRHARRLLDAIGWSHEATTTRGWLGGATVALSAPLDGLFAACEVNEAAWHAAVAELGGAAPPDFSAAVASLCAAIAAEAKPGLLSLASAAEQHRVAWLSDPDEVSLGLGSGARTWPVNALPVPDAVPWPAVHDVPVALVTGTNGKTTTVRLLAALLAAGGHVAGQCGTGGVQVGEETVAHGDYSGPEGARLVLRHPRATAAVLELARGGILRRGLPVRKADVAVVTNISADHLGEYGITDVEALADCKMLVTRAVGPSGHVVLNAEDPRIVARSQALAAPITWFATNPAHPVVTQHLAQGGRAAFAEDGWLMLAEGAQRRRILPVADAPITFGGAARHNVANALAALAAAWSLGVDEVALAHGLHSFQGSSVDNPGRANVFHLGTVTALVDFAHNADGLQALVDLAAGLPARRRLILVGQAGDRSDDEIRELAGIAWRLAPDLVVTKEIPSKLRGRALGEVPAVVSAELLRLGASQEQLIYAVDEPTAVRLALEWARPGDLLVLLIHSHQAATLARLQALAADGWQAGAALS